MKKRLVCALLIILIFTYFVWVFILSQCETGIIINISGRYNFNNRLDPSIVIKRTFPYYLLADLNNDVPVFEEDNGMFQYSILGTAGWLEDTVLCIIINYRDCSAYLTLIESKGAEKLIDDCFKKEGYFASEHVLSSRRTGTNHNELDSLS